MPKPLSPTGSAPSAANTGPHLALSRISLSLDPFSIYYALTPSNGLAERLLTTAHDDTADQGSTFFVSHTVSGKGMILAVQNYHDSLISMLPMSLGQGALVSCATAADQPGLLCGDLLTTGSNPPRATVTAQSGVWKLEPHADEPSSALGDPVGPEPPDGDSLGHAPGGGALEGSVIAGRAHTLRPILQTGLPATRDTWGQFSWSGLPAWSTLSETYFGPDASIGQLWRRTPLGVTVWMLKDGTAQLRARCGVPNGARYCSAACWSGPPAAATLCCLLAAGRAVYTYDLRAAQDPVTSLPVTNPAGSSATLWATLSEDPSFYSVTALAAASATPAGTSLLLAGTHGGSVLAWDTRNQGQPLWVHDMVHSGPVTDVAWNAHGSWAASTAADRQVAVIGSPAAGESSGLAVPIQATTRPGLTIGHVDDAVQTLVWDPTDPCVCAAISSSGHFFYFSVSRPLLGDQAADTRSGPPDAD